MRRRTPHKLPSHRISTVTAAMMIAVAITFDCLQMIPKLLIFLFGVGLAIELPISLLISTTGYATLWLWFQMRGVGVLKGSYMSRKFVVLLGGMTLEMLPLLNALPAITSWTITTILVTRREDNEARAKMKKQIEAEELQMRRAALAIRSQRV